MVANMSLRDTSAHIMPVSGNEKSDQLSMQVRSQQLNVSTGPVAILWDIENCPIPTDTRAEDVAGNIRAALRSHPAVRGAVTLFSAYGDFNKFPRKLREGCQKTGVNLIDVPNGRKDAADKAILVDMFLFALDYPPPSTIFLISGDVDFAPALHKLGQRHYTVVLAIPNGARVSSALLSSSQFVWNWGSVARGEGLLPAKSFLPRAPELSFFSLGSSQRDDSDCPNDEESIVYKGIPTHKCAIGSKAPQSYSVQSTATISGFSPQVGVSLSARHQNQNQTSSVSENCVVVRPTSSDVLQISQQNKFSNISNLQTSETQHYISSRADSSNITQCGDIQKLKGQLLQLVSMFAGMMFLKQVPSEYQKVFGRPLYLAEYDCRKLVVLLRKMSDVFRIEGTGSKKVLCMRRSAVLTDNYRNIMSNTSLCNENSSDIIDKEDQLKAISKALQTKTVEPYPSKDLVHENEKDDYVVENAICHSDEASDEEKPDPLLEDIHTGELRVKDMNPNQDGARLRLEVFREELEELLVSHACKILLASFLPLYRQRYAKDIVYSAYNVEDLESLLGKVQDIALIEEEQSTKRKFLIANCRYRYIIE